MSTIGSDFAAERTKFLNQAAEQRETHRNEVDNLQEGHSKELKRIKTLHKKELNNQDKAHSANISDVRERFNESTAETKQKFFDKLQEERESHRQTSGEDLRNFREKLDNISKQYEISRDAAMKNHRDIEAYQKDRYDKALKDERATMEDNLKEAISNQRNKTQDTVDNLRFKRQQAAESHRKDFQKFIAEETRRRQNMGEEYKRSIEDIKSAKQSREAFDFQRDQAVNAAFRDRLNKERAFQTNIQEIKDAQSTAINDRKQMYVDELRKEKEQNSRNLTNQIMKDNFEKSELSRIFRNNKNQMESVHQGIQQNTRNNFEKQSAAKQKAHEGEVRGLIEQVERVSQSNSLAAANRRRANELRHQDALASLQNAENLKRLDLSTKLNDTLNRQRSSHNAELEDLKLFQKDQLDRLNQNHEKNVKKLEDNYRELATNMERRSSREMRRSTEGQNAQIELLENQFAKDKKIQNKKLNDALEALNEATGAGNSRIQDLRNKYLDNQRNTRNAFLEKIELLEQDKNKMGREYRKANMGARQDAADREERLLKELNNEMERRSAKASREKSELKNQYSNILKDQESLFNDTFAASKARAQKRFDNTVRIANKNIEKVTEDGQENFKLMQEHYAGERSDYNAKVERAAFERINHEIEKHNESQLHLENAYKERLDAKDTEIENITNKYELEIDNLEKRITTIHAEAQDLLNRKHAEFTKDKAIALKSQKLDFEKQLAEVRRAAQKEAKNLQREFDIKLREQQDLAKTRARTENRERIAELRRRETSMKLQMAKLTKTQAIERQQLIDQYEDKIEKIKQNYEEKSRLLANRA